MRACVADERQIGELRYQLFGRLGLGVGPIPELEQLTLFHHAQCGHVRKELRSVNVQIGQVGAVAYMQLIQLMVEQGVDTFLGQLVVRGQVDAPQPHFALIAELRDDDQVVKAMLRMIHLQETVTDLSRQRRGGLGRPVLPRGPFVADALHTQLDEGIRSESGQPELVHASSIGRRGRACAPAALHS